MFAMDIKELIGEATEYDKKLALEEKKPKSWCKSVSAFANTFGRALIFGISNDGQVIGLNNPEGDAEKIFLLFPEQYACSCRNIAWRL